MAVEEIDILIVGGGLIGASLLLALEKTNLKILLVERKNLSQSDTGHFDARTLALAPASKRILNMLGVWELLSAKMTPIDHIHVSEQFRFGHTRLEHALEPLGYVVEMQHLQNAFFTRLKNSVQILAPAVVNTYAKETGIVTIEKEGALFSFKPKLMVAADGSESELRKYCELKTQYKDYHQCALAANIGLNRPHQNRAYERFTSTGPLALLPMTQQRSALIWTLSPDEAKKTIHMNEKTFLKKLQSSIGYRLGRLNKVGRRELFSLRQVVMPQQTAWPIVFVGNAAHTLHPIAGQGFNLGLRDIAFLAQSIIQKGLNPAMLEYYQAARSTDQKAIVRFTDGLIELFKKQIPGMPAARGLGLLAFDLLGPLKKIVTQCAQGFTGAASDLVCEIPLLQRNENESNL